MWKGNYYTREIWTNYAILFSLHMINLDKFKMEMLISIQKPVKDTALASFVFSSALTMIDCDGQTDYPEC